MTASVNDGALADPAEMLADGVVLSELHAANVMTAAAAQTTSATKEDIRKEFTVVTLHPRHAIPASGPVVETSATSWPRGSQNRRTAA